MLQVAPDESANEVDPIEEPDLLEQDPLDVDYLLEEGSRRSRFRNLAPDLLWRFQPRRHEALHTTPRIAAWQTHNKRPGDPGRLLRELKSTLRLAEANGCGTYRLGVSESREMHDVSAEAIRTWCAWCAGQTAKSQLDGASNPRHQPTARNREDAKDPLPVQQTNDQIIRLCQKVAITIPYVRLLQIADYYSG